MPRHYSVDAMDAELTALDAKLSQLITLVRSLRSENQQLRQQLAEQVDAGKRMKEKLDQAARRLESLLTQVPGA